LGILGDCSALPELQVDMATMTGNVAQVFLTDGDWMAMLSAARNAMRPGGSLACPFHGFRRSGELKDAKVAFP
jgi:hypothetical protein